MVCGRKKAIQGGKLFSHRSKYNVWGHTIDPVRKLASPTLTPGLQMGRGLQNLNSGRESREMNRVAKFGLSFFWFLLLTRDVNQMTTSHLAESRLNSSLSKSR